jgi:hypothetical protein
VPLYFNLVGTVADVDETTPEHPCHPSPVILIDTDDKIERFVLPAWAWPGPRDAIQVGRRLRVSGELEFPAKPVAFHVELIDVH